MRQKRKGKRDNGDSPACHVSTMSHADISGHKTAGDVTAFAKYNHLVIALPTSELVQSNDEAFVHGSFHAQMGTVPFVTPFAVSG